MPRRDDIKTILIIGSGPIIIGQGCEFDYSGTQACKALREEGYKIVLINSNPATIMTDPEFADRTYIEPITPQAVAKIIQAELNGPFHIDAMLPTLGGQTGLNTAVAVYDMGVLDCFGVEMIGATRQVIHRAEDRTEFKNICLKIGLEVPASGVAHNMEDARRIAAQVGLPVCIRPAYTLGGTGGGFAFNKDEFETIADRGLRASPISEILIEQSVLGWKEFELEVMRDKADNVVIVCSIENFDPMGVHTGDSITVAPIQTLTDKEYQLMRDASIAIIRAVGVETGGSNIQFATDPKTGRMVVVEMNPRVSRSSALASKATGFPIAKIAAKLAVGYTLDEIPNDITRQTPACFEPTIDYCVVKIPRWTFEKFPDADETLTTQMKSVGEAMSIGRTFKEALQKGIRSMEVKRFGLGLDNNDKWLKSIRTKDKAGEKGKDRGQTDAVGSEDTAYPVEESKLRRKLAVPSQGRLYYIRYALKMGWSVEQIYELTAIDPWFLTNLKELVDFEDELVEVGGIAKVYIDASSMKSLEMEHGAKGWETDPVMKKQAQKTAQRIASLPVDIKTKDMEEGWVENLLRKAKQWGYSDIQLATIWGTDDKTIRRLREFAKIKPVYKLVDTCAAEFEAYTPYYYSSYETPMTRVETAGGKKAVFRGTDVSSVCPMGVSPMECLKNGTATAGTAVEHTGKMPVPLFQQTAISKSPAGQFVDDEVRVTDKKKIVILGGGPNRIGQGIEFDYCCVQAAFAAKELGFESVMINSNPETVSTDYDTSDMLFFEPLTHEDVVNICERINGRPLKQPEGLLYGVIVQFGGQTPLNLARGLEEAGVPIIGTTPDMIDVAEDRKRFAEVLDELKLKCPAGGTAFSIEGARSVANRIGYPVLVRPSYVLGGRAMEIVSDEAQLDVYMAKAVNASTVGRDHPILVDKFLDNATEIDVDCLADFGPRRDGTREKNPRSVICGVMEHIEEAGIHSGDSACAIPHFSLPDAIVAEIERQARLLAEKLQVRGLMNVQFAVKDDQVYILEVNPRASRTVPFVSKATGVSWAKLAAKVMAGKSLEELNVTEAPRPGHTSVKESVFPFAKFPGVDVILGPEMRSTGEVMGVDRSFGMAFAKSQMGTGGTLPSAGKIFISVCQADKPLVGELGRRLAAMGYELAATDGTQKMIAAAGARCATIPKLAEGRPNIADLIANNEIALIINTPTRRGPTTDEGKIRALATIRDVPIITTMTSAEAAVQAMESLHAAQQVKGDSDSAWSVKPLQEYFPNYRNG
ncbi:MAG: carbamoyl-phosphate synthase large subunit [Planctomycetes bacterium]|nr:carbamoyl-phosphate synthase large subunit [Planctomycetota bacterium]